MIKIYLLIYNRKKKFQFYKYFDTIREKDNYKRKIKWIKDLLLIEDSTENNYY